ncbi:MAG: sialidase family protein, partial [Bacteroidales bacterium]
MKNKIGFILLISGLVFFRPLFSSAQDAPKTADKKKHVYHENEKPDDKYLPNAYNNKKTTPAYKYVSPSYKFKKTPPVKSSGSSIYTVQVNVNSGGQNIVGDAANEPNIAIDPQNPNNIVIGWRQFDNVTSNFRQAGWSYTTDGGLTWNFPGEIEQGVFRSDPVLDFDTTGNFYYNSLTLDSAGNYLCKVFKSTDGAASWNAGVNAGGGDKQWMAIDRTEGVGSGNIYATWSFDYNSCSPGFFIRSEDEGSSFESCIVLNDSSIWGTMAVGVNGELYISGTDNYGNILVGKSSNANVPSSVITWDTASTLNLDGYINISLHINPVGLLGQVNIDVDRSNGPGRGNVYVLASVTRYSNNDTADVMFSGSTDGGHTWSTPVRVNDDVSTTNYQWFGTMSVAPNGRIDAVWLDNRDAPYGSDSSALYYSYSTDQGTTWSTNEKMSALFDPHTGYPNQNKMGDYFDMVSDNTGAHLAWSNTLNGEEDVYYSHIVPNINTGVNGISNNAAFSVFPNPTDGMFFITSEAKQF